MAAPFDLPPQARPLGDLVLGFSETVVQLAEEWHQKASSPGGREELGARLEALLAEVNGQVEEYERMQFWRWHRTSGTARTIS